MEWGTGKPSLLKNFLVRMFLLCLMIIGIRFVYVVTIRGESCDSDNFCFFSPPGNPNLVIGVKESSSSAIILSDTALSSPEKTAIWSSEDWKRSVDFYSSVFQDLIAEGYLLPTSKSLCLETPMGQEVYALKEIGVLDAIGIYSKSSKPLVISGQANHPPFRNNSFDFIFSSNTGLDSSLKQGEFAVEVGRTLKPEGFLVVHTASKDTYSFNSFIDLFNCCKFIRSRELQATDASTLTVREIVMKKVSIQDNGESSVYNECLIPEYKKQLVKKAEPLIREEPLKPWITLKKNIKNVKYLSSMADINFKQRYVYVDVGARSYGSSIVSWFKKQYPKQNKTFNIYAIEADKVFHEEYRSKKGVALLPYAAWVRNESLFFEVNDVIKGGQRGMGRIKPVQSSSSSSSMGNKISGFDFANWLKNTVTEKDFVVMKMDVEGTEFDLIPRLYETGAICLIDELFLECHYNRWQKCCPGQRSPKYEKTYGQCLELFTSLRQSGVLVHQWW